MWPISLQLESCHLFKLAQKSREKERILLGRTTDSRHNSNIKCNKWYFLFSLALSPRWDETFSFTVQVPELALIRFCVQDEISLVANDFLGQYTLPLLSLSKGNIFLSEPPITLQSYLQQSMILSLLWYWCSTALCVFPRGAQSNSRLKAELFIFLNLCSLWISLWCRNQRTINGC